MTLFSIAGLTLGVTSFLVTLLIVFFGKTTLHKIWALFNIVVGLWGISAFFLGQISSRDVALVVWRIAHVPIAFIAVFIFHLVYKLCSLKSRKLLFFAYLQGFTFSIIALFSNLFISDVKYVFNSFYYDVAGPLFHPFFAIWGFLVMFAHFKLFITYLHVKGSLKKQIMYLLVGSGLGFTGGITNFLPALGIELYPFGNFTIPIYCVIATYAILKYRLMDINIAFTRAGIFIVVYSLVLGVPIALAFGWQDNLIKIFGANWWILPLVCSTLLATIGPFIYLYINKKAEDRLLKEQRSYQNILRNASSGMIRIKDLKRLLNVVIHVITKTVKIKYAAVYVLDKETNNFILQAARGKSASGDQGDYIDAGSPLIWQLSLRKNPIVTEEEVMKLRDEAQNQGVIKFVEQLLKLNASLVVPSFVDDKLTGILILGEKASGKLYSEDDLVVFSVLANQSALAIENAQFYDEVKKTHEQLFQAEKMATIGTMADGLSHQINNRFHALSLIAGDSLDFLKHSDMSSFSTEAKDVLAELKSALERIENNVLQGGEVVKGLLKYSRPGDSGFELVSFQDVLNGSIDMVQYKINLKEFDLVQNIVDDVPKLYGNLTQLQEVFFNLIDNAYDAIKERQILLKEDGFRGKIEVSAIGADGALEIIVADNGMGIKDLDKKKLFTPFFTTKATAKKGTGLGLYVLDKIIGAHNGKIAIDSIYKSGTRFTITLPTTPKS